MRIVVLDGYSVNPGDLSWVGLAALGEVTVYDRTAAGEVMKRAAEAEILLTNKVFLGREIIAALPRLRYIGVLATGVNVVDLAAAGERGIPVTNVPDYSTASVAQMVFAHLLEQTQQVGHHAQAVREGSWSACKDFCFWEKPLIELQGLTMGIVGFGRIGRRVAQAATAFGMQVLVHTAHPERYPEAKDLEGLRFADLETLFRQSDVISLHCPLTPETERLVNAERLALMKPSAYLINTGRGPLIDESALAAALNQGRLAGAGLDVLSVEPPPADHPLLQTRNCIITPHIAWATRAARERLMATVTENVRAFLSGHPVNVVNP